MLRPEAARQQSGALPNSFKLSTVHGRDRRSSTCALTSFCSVSRIKKTSMCCQRYPNRCASLVTTVVADREAADVDEDADVVVADQTTRIPRPKSRAEKFQLTPDAEAVVLSPMTAAVKAVIEQAMQLSPEERAEVANALDGMSVEAPALSREDLAAAWRPELDRRRQELERGEVQTVDAREAIAGIRARLRNGQ